MARIEPHVLFPVVWPAELAGATDGVLPWVVSSIETHHRYMAAVAEIARRNGGGGWLLVERMDDKPPATVPLDGKCWGHTIMLARWVRHVDEMPNAVSDHGPTLSLLQKPPTQTEFTTAVVWATGTTPAWSAMRVVGAFHADHLAALERGGLDEHTAVVAAMDGGGANGATLVVS